MGDHAFNRGMFSKTGDNALQTVRVDAPAGDILRASGIAALNNQHLRPFTGEHQRRDGTRQPGPHDDGIKDIFGHKNSRFTCQRQGRYPQALPEWISVLKRS